ncbi:MAG TPA: Uma2 family endonuclease [Thermoanaerobaculia bacterium]|nr:Uma2 family endonuclease [Thermoanaerobaculia bacterium]
MADPLKRLFTNSEYHTMAETGILSEDDRVELIEGEIFQMAPIGNRHVGSVNRLIRAFAGPVGERAVVTVQNPIHLNDFSEPQPDFVLLHPRDDLYSRSDVRPEDVLLLVEVSDASLEYDRRRKIPLYARHGIPEAWLINLVQDFVEVHRDPSPSGYRDVRKLRRGDRLSSQAFPDLVIPVDYLLG